MRPIKIAGKVHGGYMTSAEREAMKIEIQKEFAEYDRKNAIEIEAMCLYVIRKVFKKGKKSLKQFHDDFYPEIEKLCARYEMDTSEKVWLCTHMLKEEGIDIEAWVKADEKEGKI